VLGGANASGLEPAQRRYSSTACQAPNYRLLRTVIRHRVRAASASFHCALATRRIRHRAAAEPGR